MKTYSMTTYDIYSIVCTIIGEHPVEANKNWKHHWDQIKRSDQVLRVNKCSPAEKCRACGHTGDHAFGCKLDLSSYAKTEPQDKVVFTRIPIPWTKCQTPGYVLTDIPGFEGQRRFVFSISETEDKMSIEVGHYPEELRKTVIFQKSSQVGLTEHTMHLLYPTRGEVWAFVGRAGAGKSTIASYLTKSRPGWVRDRLAGPLKEMLKVGLGLTDAQVDGDEKTIPAPELCGMTPRYAMQTLGTEWGRKLIDPDLWTDALVRRCQEAVAMGKTVVVDDVRFVNEAEALRRIGAKIIKIERPVKRKFNLLDWLFKRGQYHPSETGVEKIMPDFIIKNAFGIDALEREVDNVINHWGSYVPNEEME